MAESLFVCSFYHHVAYVLNVFVLSPKLEWDNSLYHLKLSCYQAWKSTSKNFGFWFEFSH